MAIARFEIRPATHHSQAVPAKNWQFLYLYFGDSDFHLSIAGAATTNSPKFPAGTSINFTGSDMFDGAVSVLSATTTNVSVNGVGNSSP